MARERGGGCGRGKIYLEEGADPLGPYETNYHTAVSARLELDPPPPPTPPSPGDRLAWSETVMRLGQGMSVGDTRTVNQRADGGLTVQVTIRAPNGTNGGLASNSTPASYRWVFQARYALRWVQDYQPEWRWCDRCQGLFYGPEVANSACPACGTHTPPLDQSGSGNVQPAGQRNPRPNTPERLAMVRQMSRLILWTKCRDSVCPAGGTHTRPDQSGSGNYSLPHNAFPDPTRQDNWLWCDKCQGLSFGPNVANSVCAAGGTHTFPDINSEYYSLPYERPLP